MASAAEFARKMKSLSDLVAKNVDKAVRGAALAIDQQVVQATPVDTGRARSNWLVSLNAPVSVNQEPYAPGKDGSTAGANVAAAIQQAESVISTRQPGQDIWIGNSVPYIGKLNEDSSAQAPANFVETAVMRGVDVIRQARLID